MATAYFTLNAYFFKTSERLQAVISALTSGKFYQLPPDKENSALVNSHNFRAIALSIKVTPNLNEATFAKFSFFFFNQIKVRFLRQYVPENENKMLKCL